MRNQLFLAILFSVLTVVGSGAGAVGDLLVAANTAALDDLNVSDSATRKRLNRDMGTNPDHVNHHVIPVSLRNHNLIVRAARSGWHMNKGANNGYAFRKNPFHPKGSTHPRHTKEIKKLLDKLEESADVLN